MALWSDSDELLAAWMMLDQTDSQEAVVEALAGMTGWTREKVERVYEQLNDNGLLWETRRKTKPQINKMASQPEPANRVHQFGRDRAERRPMPVVLEQQVGAPVPDGEPFDAQLHAGTNEGPDGISVVDTGLGLPRDGGRSGRTSVGTNLDINLAIKAERAPAKKRAHHRKGKSPKANK